MKNKDKIIKQNEDYILGTYTRIPVIFVKGKGISIWDSEGNEYLDFFPGWAVSGLGHSPEPVVNAITDQVNNIIHVSNN